MQKMEDLRKSISAREVAETVCEMMLRLTGIDIALCPKCGKGKMKLGHPLAKTVSVQAQAPT
jgi:hypothetical protein